MKRSVRSCEIHNQNTDEWLNHTPMQRLAERLLLAARTSSPRLMTAVNELESYLRSLLISTKVSKKAH